MNDVSPLSANVACLLTERQLEVACYLVEGFTIREVAVRIGRSQYTVHEHVRQMYQRLDCHNRSQLVALVVRSGVCQLRSE